MNALTEAAKSVSLPVVQKPSGFHWTEIQWADIVGNPLRAITTRDCWVLKGDVVDEGTPDAKLIEAGTVGWFCVKVSEGCRDCYSETMNIRFGCGLNYKAQYLKSGLVKIVLDEQRIEAMLKWKIPKGFKSKVDGSERPKCFPFDMTDLAGEWVTDEMLDTIFAVAALRLDIDFMFLTKRIERMAEYLNRVYGDDSISKFMKLTGKSITHYEVWRRANELQPESFGFTPDTNPKFDGIEWPLPNVLIGASAENQKTFNQRIGWLLKCPAALRFMSLEPLLEEIDLNAASRTPGAAANEITEEDDALGPPLGGVDGVHLFIGGCESGSSRRHIHDDAYGSILAQCEAAGVAYFHKQSEVDGKVTGEISKFTIQLRVRQFPQLLTKET